mmetsp:Transcript_38467/g.109976  ORF Transcript_38467/g.109976 Transcript_38467/m.109976 type:complete len:293 (-) Transcript_38467:497-1375(-)
MLSPIRQHREVVPIQLERLQVCQLRHTRHRRQAVAGEVEVHQGRAVGHAAGKRCESVVSEVEALEARELEQRLREGVEPVVHADHHREVFKARHSLRDGRDLIVGYVHLGQRVAFPPVDALDLRLAQVEELHGQLPQPPLAEAGHAALGASGEGLLDAPCRHRDAVLFAVRREEVGPDALAPHLQLFFYSHLYCHAAGLQARPGTWPFCELASSRLSPAFREGNVGVCAFLSIWLRLESPFDDVPSDQQTESVGEEPLARGDRERGLRGRREQKGEDQGARRGLDDQGGACL